MTSNPPGTGGLPSPRPDQTRAYPPTGTQPGSQSGIFSRIFVGGDFVINTNGAFFYSGKPAAGNPPILYETSPGVTTDPFSNVLPTSTGGLTTVAGSLFTNLLGVALELGGGSMTGPAAVSVNTTGTLFISSGTSAGEGQQAQLELIPAAGAPATASFVSTGVNVNGGKAGNVFAVGTGPSDFTGTVYLEDGAQPATPGTAAALYSTSGQLKFVDEQGNVNNAGRSLFLATGQTVNSTSLQNVAGITGISVAAGTYRVHGILKCTKGGTADTNKFGITGPGTGGVEVTCKAYLDNVAGYTGILTSNMPATFGSTTTASVNPAVNFSIEFDGTITFTAAGTTFGLEVACGTANADTWTVNGGYMIMEPGF